MRVSSVLVWFMLGSLAMSASAETQQVRSTIYGINIDEAKSEKLSNGVGLQYGGVLHGHTVNADGTQSSQWCQNADAADKDGKFIGGGGFCTVIDESGDMLWVWLRSTSATTNDWGVIGGTGSYAGATGGGTTTQVKTLPDGTLVFESKGTLTTR